MTTSRVNKRTTFLKDYKREKKENNSDANSHSITNFLDYTHPTKSTSYNDIIDGINNMKVKPVQTAKF